jgi:hypothetical protein
VLLLKPREAVGEAADTVGSEVAVVHSRHGRRRGLDRAADGWALRF